MSVDRLTTAPSWRCFHCDEVFTTWGAARDHFGAVDGAEPGCRIDQVAVEEGGKPERGRGLLMALRKVEAEYAELLRRQCAEDTDLHRQMAALRSDHAAALRREEEAGYARGLADAEQQIADYVLSCREDRSVVQVFDVLAKHIRERMWMK